MILLSASTPSSLFVYGTLMSPRVLKILIGRVPGILQPVVLNHHCRHPVIDEVFPGMIPGVGSTTGVLLQGLSPNELTVLDWFEGDEYTRKDVEVQKILSDELAPRKFSTQCYIWANGITELDQSCEWDYKTFEKTKLNWYLKNSVRPCRAELNSLGIGRYD
eukprot:CAMPEP_0202442968 /NCGR_PEP_ID=MMETSP1360-20130828/2322_1 /ASSEMBLY_ACC=CAM_ASM_000848 /TAXON_ID=515479 /ORGANISM="Licmophora paradoxa, Strain CCMP2313" /LENGTH=161 /DNA_ID=CAMNT_0049058507 /DNA_START=75 /DNA_END=560 /DNA_ORIENTATION=+